MWTVADVAKASGVTPRALRHYDAIGLLPPAGTAANGYREYGVAELLRLQEILVLRELGMPLGEIRAVLDARRDRVAALREHHRRLVVERDRLAAVVDTIARTIADLEHEQRSTPMTIDRPEHLFDGFDHERYAEEARRRWPQEAASAEQHVAAMSGEDQEERRQEWTARLVRVAELHAAHADPADERVQAEMQGVHQWVMRTWTPTAESFAGLGRLYVDDERFAAGFDRIGPGLAGFYRDAMGVYAEAHLT